MKKIIILIMLIMIPSALALKVNYDTTTNVNIQKNALNLIHDSEMDGIKSITFVNREIMGKYCGYYFFNKNIQISTHKKCEAQMLNMIMHEIGHHNWQTKMIPKERIEYCKYKKMSYNNKCVEDFADNYKFQVRMK